MRSCGRREVKCFIYFMLFVLQGPALCVYNNQQFQEKDWEGIRRLHTSVKEKDPLKVGRFGLGFKSVFHLTGEIIPYFLLTSC